MVDFFTLTGTLLNHSSEPVAKANLKLVTIGPDDRFDEVTDKSYVTLPQVTTDDQGNLKVKDADGLGVELIVGVAYRLSSTGGQIEPVTFISDGDDLKFASLPRDPVGVPSVATWALEVVRLDGRIDALEADGGGPGGVGPAGPQGPIGPAGPQGPAGAAGAAGAQGIQGERGLTGDAGPTGPTGATGAAGPKGDAGTTGATGPKGDTGAQGPQGIQGVKGDTGATGATGATGPSGGSGAITTATSVLAAEVALPTTLTTILTIDLGVGTWDLTSSLTALASGNAAVEMIYAFDTAAGTIAANSGTAIRIVGANIPSTGILSALVTVTTAGRVALRAIANTTSTAKANLTQLSTQGGATAMKALKVG